MGKLFATKLLKGEHILFPLFGLKSARLNFSHSTPSRAPHWDAYNPTKEHGRSHDPAFVENLKYALVSLNAELWHNDEPVPLRRQGTFLRVDPHDEHRLDRLRLHAKGIIGPAGAAKLGQRIRGRLATALKKALAQGDPWSPEPEALDPWGTWEIRTKSWDPEKNLKVHLRKEDKLLHSLPAHLLPPFWKMARRSSLVSTSLFRRRPNCCPECATDGEVEKRLIRARLDLTRLPFDQTQREDAATRAKLAGSLEDEPKDYRLHPHLLCPLCRGDEPYTARHLASCPMNLPQAKSTQAYVGKIRATRDKRIEEIIGRPTPVLPDERLHTSKVAAVGALATVTKPHYKALGLNACRWRRVQLALAEALTGTLEKVQEVVLERTARYTRKETEREYQNSMRPLSANY